MDDFDVTKLKGLSEEEVAQRLEEEGYNEIPSKKKKTGFYIAFEVIREPMFLLLVACGTLYFILGDIQEGIMLLFFVFVIIGITFYQERKTERALEALRDLSSPRASVIRNGEQKRIAGREVVRGDILILSEGDRVPADAILLNCSNFFADESLLTGESVPVRKSECKEIAQMIPPGGDGLPFVYSGTLVVRGQGVAQVEATGIKTEMGKIGKALQSLDQEGTHLQKETKNIIKYFSIAGFLLCLIIIIFYGLSRGNWIQGFLAGLTLAMAILPEEFPVVLTVFLALGAWRISQNRVLTRRVPAVETLGSATVLCVDKTGTLTQNRMTVKKIVSDRSTYEVNYDSKQSIPEEFHEIVEFSILASQKEPFDPMEKAFKELGNHYLFDTEHIHNDWKLMREYPLSEELLAMSHVWKSPDGKDYIISAKGAPEAIIDLCHLEETRKNQILSDVDKLAKEGLRVLGVARSDFKEINLPTKQHDFKFDFLGLIGLMDPIRPSVPNAVKECYDAGIKIIMITGDYPSTAQNIGRQIGLKNPEKIVTGSELDKMTDDELQKIIKDISIFARVVPEQKLRIVNALKFNGDIVAMTGDGVNDAPALKSSNIGIAMGGRGTDVARESADLVLLDDDFSSIVKSVRMGRRIFDNLKKAMAYILAIHVPIAGMSLIPVLLKMPLVLLPVHIVFLELIIDPACSVVFEAEPEEANVMNRPPRSPKENIFGRSTALLSFLQGFSVLFIVLVTYIIVLSRGQGEMEARAFTFTTLIVANLALIFTNRSWTRTILTTLKSPNSALWYVTFGALLFLGMVLYIPFLRDLFLLSILHINDILICLVLGIASVLWFEVLKIIKLKLNTNG